MTREEVGCKLVLTKDDLYRAINTLKRNGAILEDGPTLYISASALQHLVPQPDPDTGLVPCGCGGKALYYLMPNIDAGMMSIYAVCPECGERSGTVVGMYDLSADGIKMIVRDAWNRAMGHHEKSLNAKPENHGTE